MDNIIDYLNDVHPAVFAVVAFCLYYELKALSHIFKTFLRPGKDLKKFGKWAVVTGATDGIGKEYSLALAKKGLSVVLISRTESKLQDVKKLIDDKQYKGVEVKYIVCDYSKFNEKSLQKMVEKEIQDLDVGVLINNVGVSYRYPQYWMELSEDEVQNLLIMNIDSTVWMTRMVLKGMIERKRGTILNIGSGPATNAPPLLAQYSGVKSFVEMFSRALNSEYKHIGITVQCQDPFYVATKLAKMRKSFLVPTAKEYVNSAIRWIGYPGDNVASPIFFHSLMGLLYDVLPENIAEKIVTSMHLATRKLGKKKDARLAAAQQETTSESKKTE